MSLTLSTGHSVSFRPHYTHRMESAFKEELTKGMNLQERNGEVVVEQIKADALDRAVEAVLAHLIEKISKDGQDIPFSKDWLLDLPEPDFLLLRDVVTERRADNEDKKEAGKKNR